MTDKKLDPERIEQWRKNTLPNTLAAAIFDSLSASRETFAKAENMLEDVVNELDLSDGMIEKHGPLGTTPAEMVREVLDRKDREIAMLKAGMISLPNNEVGGCEPTDLNNTGA